MNKLLKRIKNILPYIFFVLVFLIAGNKILKNKIITYYGIQLILFTIVIGILSFYLNYNKIN